MYTSGAEEGSVSLRTRLHRGYEEKHSSERCLVVDSAQTNLTTKEGVAWKGSRNKDLKKVSGSCEL